MLICTAEKYCGMEMHKKHLFIAIYVVTKRQQNGNQNEIQVENNNIDNSIYICCIWHWRKYADLCFFCG